MNKTEQLVGLPAYAESRLANDPPLRAVRAFEAIARLGSVTLAAQELDISPSAVSHQLRVLEGYLQMPLTEHLAEQAQTRQVTISLIPLFGMGWFIPRLPAFMRANPQTEINVVYANHRNYLSDASDMSIRFGNGQWAGYQSEKLISGQMVPVCSRAFLRIHGHIDTPEQLLQMPLLHDEERTTWAQWFVQQGVKRPVRRSGPMFEDGLLTLAGVQAGLGGALMREPLIAPYLESGELVKIFDLPIDDGRDYYLCVRSDSEMTEDGKLLQNWLRRAAGGESSGG
ncbi:LysR family transcriptional regulator [Enterobacter roggenkampii]